MVKDPGTALRAHRLRPLAKPRRIRVEPGDCTRPHAVLFEGMMCGVATVQDRWRIDDEWWRETPVARLYYQLQLENGRVVTVYRDLLEGEWWEQRY
jgi:hypothetical protein